MIEVLNSLLLLLLLTVIISVKSLDFYKHGLFWGGKPFSNASIHDNGNWQVIDGSSLYFYLPSDKTTLISYNIGIEALRIINGLLLPQVSTMDIVQIRCVLDGIPLRYSSSYASVYDVEQRTLSTLSSTFAVNLTSENHVIFLEWKKTGTRIEKWIINGGNNKYAITVQAEHENIQSSTESKDKFLYNQDIWKPLSDILTFYVNYDREVILGYSFTAQPQLQSFIKDRNIEYIMSRLSIDGSTFEESSDIFGTNGWNPSSHVLRGTIKVQLEKGYHSVYIMWRKHGRIFKGWSSSPSYLDGFTNSRNLFVLMEDYNSPALYLHNRDILHSSNVWSNVGNEDNTLSFNLIKESAVLITYALPVSQFENPNFDSNIWAPLSNIDSRLIVDNVAYTYAGGDTISFTSRKVDDLFGSLALVLPAGSHSVYLQWRSDGFNWTILNDFGNGFSHGNNLLVYVSSENSRPNISCPTDIYGYEDIPLILQNIQVSDLDSMLIAGITLELNISITFGTLSFPNTLLLSQPIVYIHGINNSTVRIKDNVLNINSALRDFVYISPSNWYGEDMLSLTLSDDGNTGFDGTALITTFTSKIIIHPVDDMFTVQYTPYQYVRNINEAQNLAPIELNDVDAQDSVFRVQLSSTCGILSLCLSQEAMLYNNVVFFLGDGINDTAMDFQASFNVTQSILKCTIYTPETVCNQAVHQEVVIFRVIDVSNNKDLEKIISLDVIRENLAPEIVGGDLPRWKLRGLKAIQTNDMNDTASIVYRQYPSLIETSYDLFNEQLIAQPFVESSSYNELSVFSTSESGTYAFSMQFQSFPIKILESSYLEINSPRTITLLMMEKLQSENLTAKCSFGNIASVATIYLETSTAKCNVVYQSSNSQLQTEGFKIEWLKLTIFIDNDVLFESNYVPLFIVSNLEIFSLSYVNIFPLSQSILQINTNLPGIVNVCVFNELSVLAIVYENFVNCRVPPLNYNTSNVVVRLESKNSYFKSNELILNVLTVPVISGAYVDRDIMNGLTSFIIEGQWDFEVFEIAHNIYCIVDDDLKFVATQFSELQIICQVSSNFSYLLTSTNNLTISMLFDNQATNSIYIEQIYSNSAKVAESYELVDYYSKTWMETGFITLLGDIGNLLSNNKSLIDCSFGGQVTKAIVVDDFTILCPIPAVGNYFTIGSFSINNLLLIKSFDKPLSIVKVPVLTRIYPDHGFVDGGTEIIIYGTGFMPSSVIFCLFDEIFIPALYESDSSISCISVPHRVGNVNLSVTVDGIFAISNVSMIFSYAEAPIITNISPKAGPVEGGFNLSVTGTGFEQAESLYCRFGSITSTAIFQSPELLTCLVPFLGYESLVEFALISDSLKVSSDIQFRYLNPAVLLGISPMYGSITGGDIVTLYGTEFIPGTMVMCIFEEYFVPARVLNYSAIECITPHVSVAGLVDLAVSVEGYEMITRAIKFSFIDPIKVLSIDPQVGSPFGETLVTVLGSGFSKISNTFCVFGNFSTPAVSLSDDRIICTTDPHEIGTFQFSLYYGDNYQKITSTPLVFTFMNPIKIVSISPTAGPLKGGTQVIVQGEGFSILEESVIESKIYCKFGTNSVVAVILSNSSISCLTPSLVSVQAVEFSLAINEIENSGNTLYFEYFNAIALTGIYPNRGSVLGGDVILLTGLSFTLKTEIYCIFGNQLSNSRIINSTAIECISPPETGTAGSKVKIGINVGGFSSISDELVFIYEPILTLHSISLQENLDIESSRRVLVAGTGFSIDSNLQCMFENISSIGIYVNESYATCIIPSHITDEQVPLKIIQTFGFSSIVSNSLIFKQYSSVVINSISPRISLIEGGTKITVLGSGFEKSAHLFCQFGETIVAGFVETNEAMTCITPSSSYPGITTIQILSHDQVINSIPMPFRYVVYPMVTDFEPRYFSSHGNDFLMVYGLSFIPGSNATCIFNSVVVVGRVLNENNIECKTPIGLLGMVNFSVELEDLPLKSFSSVVFFVTPVSILDIDVISGSTVGGTNVTITGSEFLSSSLIYCVFENTYVPAIYISTSTIICTSISHAVGTISLKVMIDSVFAVSEHPMEFSYKPSMQLYFLTPEAGALSGGTEVIVNGEGFLNFGNSLICNFGSVSSVAVIYSDNSIKCTTPSADIPTMVNFQITTQGGDVSIGRLEFRYFNSIEITSIFPVQGSISGGDIVMFRGIAFPVLSLVQCTFGDLTTNGLVRNSTVIECETPYNAFVSEVIVGLKLENYYYTSENIKFSFVEKSLLINVYPLQTSTRGGVNITFTLSEFSIFSEIICIFDILEVAAIQTSNTSIVCTAPAHSEGLVPLHVKVDGVWATTTSEQEFNLNYIVSPLISYISPASGPITGSTTVNVFGTDFDLLEDTWLCNFGNLASNVIIISNTKLICTSPVFVSTGFVDFFLSSNDKIEVSDGAIYFKYFNPVFLKAIYPSQGSILGGELTFLYGAEFIIGSFTKCIFGNYVVDARVLNFSTIQCETPSLSRNDSNVNTNYIETPVGISIDGYTFISDTISFKFIQQIVISLISPTFGSDQGGKVISVTGSGFIEDLNIFCFFGNKYSIARYISNSMISCISPANQNNSVEFSITAGAINIIYESDSLIFNYYPNPIITSLYTSNVPLLTDSTVMIEGINLSIESKLVCKFNDLITNVTIDSSIEAFCLVPSGLVGVIKQTLLNIISDDSITIYTSKFDVGIENIPSRIDIYPKVFPTQSISYVNIVGGMFYQRLQYYCYINDFYYDALLISTSKLVCGIPSMSDAMDLELSIYQENVGLIGSFVISFQLNPTITLVSSYLSKNSIILKVENLNPLFDWRCVYDTIEVNSLVQSDHEVICFLPLQANNDIKPINISLIAIQVPLQSNTYAYDLINNNIISSTNRDRTNTCSDIPGITSFRNDDSSLFMKKCELKSNKTISFVQKMMIDQKLWFKNQALYPLRSLSTLSFDYANVPSISEISNIFNTIQAVISPYSLDRSITSCAINTNTPCFVVNQDSLYQNSTSSYINIDHKSTADLNVNLSIMQAIVINSVNPYQLNTNNDTWITIEGRGFSNNSFCLINNDTFLLTTYVSTFVLQCLVESLSIHKKLILDLEIIDANKVISINKVSLVYKLCIEQNLKIYIQNNKNFSDLITTHIGSSYCTSKTGCDFNPMIPAVSDSYNAFLDLLYFNDVNYSISADYTNNKQIEYNKLQAYNFNKSAVLQQNELFEMKIKNEIQMNSSSNYPTIVLATPLSFDLLENESYYILHCYGAGFVNTSEFSLKLNVDDDNNNIVDDCYPESNSHLICLIFGSALVPNVYSFDIILQQKHAIFSSTISFTMKNIINLNKVQISSISNSNLLPRINTVEYKVVTIRPLSGSMEGSTVVAITGSNLISQVQSCTFKFDNDLQYSVPIYDTSRSSIYEIVYCISPAVSKVGIANLNLDMNNGLHLPTGYYFRFYDIPQVSYIFTSNDLGNDELTIFGSNFPIYTQSFCNVTFKSGLSLLLTAKTISSTELNCIGAYKEPFYGKVLAHVSVSFNSQDFINSDVSIIFARKHAQVSIDYLTKVNHLPSPKGFNDIVQTEIVNNLLTVNPISTSYLCDNPINIPIHHFTATQDVEYYCYLDNNYIAKAFYLSSNQMICNIPPKSPGIYELSIKASIDSKQISNVILLQCLLRPKILSVRYLPHDDGTFELIFVGLNLHPELNINCRIENFLSIGSVDSNYEIRCLFNAIDPGMKFISIETNGLIISSYNICLTVNILKNGGSLVNQNKDQMCKDLEYTSLLNAEVNYSRFSNKEIRSFSPRSGLTTGNTPVEIIVDNIGFGNTIVCMFGDVKVDAIVIDYDRVLCNTPPSSPKNTSLSLKSSDGYSSWCCGWFFYHSIVKIYSVAPSIIDRVGGNIIQIQIQPNYLILNEQLFCHFNDDGVPAFIINNSTLSCVSPFIPQLSSVNLAIGSENEIWSDSAIIAVYSSFTAEVMIAPKRGSVEGNTSVDVLLPLYFLQMNKPVCLYGTNEALESIHIQISIDANYFILRCISPSNIGKRSGSIDIYVTDSQHEITPVFYVGTFTYEVPADISSMFPTSVNQGNEVLITILGANFYDSPLLSCLINDQNMLQAQWLSNEVIICLVPAEFSVNLEVLTLRVSNNAQDISKHSQILQIIPDNMIVYLGPLTSFSMGNNEIKIVFRNTYHGKLYCRFDGSKSIVAFQIDSYSYICLTSKYEPGIVTLEIVDSSNFVLAIEHFVYYPIPIVRIAELQVAFTDYDNYFNFTGINIPINLIGRFRGDTSNLNVAGSCSYDETILGLVCSKVRSDSVNEFLFLDISINGKDFIENFVTIQVLETSQIISVDPLYVISTGNYPLGFVVDKLTSGYSTLCSFEIITDDSTYTYVTNSSIINNFSGICYVPKLPLNSMVTWSLFQKNKLIFGAVDLVMIPQPSIRNVNPSVLYTGVLTSIEISFQAAIYTYPNIFCLFQNDSYSLKIINSTLGVCTVNPIHTENSQLFLQFQNVYEKTMIAEMKVIDSVMDLQVENNNVLDFSETKVLIKSAHCLLQSDHYCSTIGVEVETLFISSCEMNCVVGKSQNINKIRLDICSAAQCFAPIYSVSLNVISSMSLIALSPAKGQVQGGIDIILFGTGFQQDINLQCTFGTVLVDMIVLSSSRAICTLPPQNPGFYDVNIVRSGFIVSNSIATFEYLPLLSGFSLESNRVSSLGGTVLTIHTQKITSTGPYECRFDEKYTPAFMINETTLSCAAPAFDVNVLLFSISLDRADVSTVQHVFVEKPPSIVFIDPIFFPALKATVVTIVFDEDLVSSNSEIFCKIDGLVMLTNYSSESTLLCYMSEGLFDIGDHVITLEQNLVEFYNLPIFARSSYSIQSITPLTSFDSISTSLTLKVTEQMSGSDFSKCCFDDILTPATLISSYEWQCYSPNTIVYQDNLYKHNALIGLARAEGFCEYFGFEFTFYKFPLAVSISKSFGSIVGGTPITIAFKTIIEFATVYCRIGSRFSLGQIDRNNIHCISMQSPVGIFDIEISTNGIDFIRTNFEFEYLPILPSLTSPEIEIIQPEIYFIEPNQVSSISQSIIVVKGAGFRFGAYCELSSSTYNSIERSSVKLISKFISESEIECFVPVHEPGTNFITVLNIGSQATSKLALEFVTDPSIYTSSSKSILPNFGSKTSETFVTIYGNNLNFSNNVLLCLVGEEWTFAIQVTSSSLQCIVPPSTFSGKVIIRIADQNKNFISGHVLFEYIDDPLLFDAQPSIGTYSTDLLVTGTGFLKFSNLTCMLGDIVATTAIISNSKAICKVPMMNAGSYSITFTTNGQHYVRSGLSFEYITQSKIDYLWPLNGPALRGGTVLSIHGEGFKDNIDLFCMVDMTLVQAVFKSSTEVQCRIPPHLPGMVNVSLVSDGALIHPIDQNLQFLYTYDASVDKITPEYGYTSGDFPLFVFGSNFLNTTGLGCKFGDMKSRGIFLSNVSILCLTPSPLGFPLLARLDLLAVEVTLNGLDYTDSNVTFAYSEPCDKGFFCPGSVKQLCPNGTYCPENARNFTLCQPGTFQPQQGQSGCVICPIGYICPDQGMPRPVNCPAGLVCDSMGLRVSNILCPGGAYCLNGTKSTSVTDFQIDKNAWSTDFVTGVVTFNFASQDWSYKDWPAPAVGKSRPIHPPELLCDGLVCAGGNTNFLAEAPFPCPIGHFCRAGAGTQIPVPKNFSTPQRCFDGFFCPRGSVSPEGTGPCPNGYFCPTQLDAIKCPRGHYCPGVGNTAPIECYPGTYNPFDGMANCTVCPTGHICPTWGTLLPELCPAGFVCVSIGLSYPVIQCPAGYWCEEGTLTIDPSSPSFNKPKICKNGQFCLGGVSSQLNVEWIPTQPYGSTKPQTCEEGTYCQAGAYLSGGTGLCFKGHYCPPNTTFPIQTPRGNFASDFGSVAPTLCYPGTYAPLYSQVNCLNCPSGHQCLGYGVYVPSVCGVGTTRQSTDSVTCSPCPTGTYAYEVGAPDLSLCLPCPPSRICGTKSMISLSQSDDCPAGYLCGYGTDRSSQFGHLNPAGFHAPPDTIPGNQYNSYCEAGFYCPRGTPTYSQFSGKCPVSYFCPRSTPAALNADTKCPMLTSSLSQLATLQGCRISDIDVCDKALILDTQPMEDLTYIETFNYELLDDTGLTLSFDSSLSSSSPTGEIQVVKKIYPINVTSSSPVWINDTVEAFRACPLYGSGSGGEDIIIIGRNFRDTSSNYCRFRACYSANLGTHPRRCQNQIKNPTGEDLRVAANVSEAAYIVRANFISSTRISCPTPEYLFEKDSDGNYLFDPDPNVVGYSCQFIDSVGTPRPRGYGNLSYVRYCDVANYNCQNLPEQSKEYFNTLTLPCTPTEIYNKICSNKPELYYMFNPCMSGEAIVEVTNDGEHYSGGNDLEQINIISTVRYADPTKIYDNFKNTTVLSTFATYTYVYPEYVYDNPEIMEMEKRYCNLPRYSEEEYRERENGWFKLNLLEVAHVQVNLDAIPDNMIYNEHYRIAIFIIPSRCTVQICSSARVRLSPEEFNPCRKPKEFSYWFQQTSVPKNLKNNITIFALDDMLFKVEIQILHGLYVAYAPLFSNTTVVRIVSPSRAVTMTFKDIKTETIVNGVNYLPTRVLTKYVSFEQHQVDMQYFFTAVVQQSDNTIVSQPLNMPPLYSDYQRGRALIMNNVSSDNDRVPTILDLYDSVNKGTLFWNMPASTADESKEQLDAYFETFQETTWDPVNGYVFELNTLVLPYLPYFSNCDTFDSYIPIWLLLEGKECTLPDTYPPDWSRYKFPALPDQDRQRMVGPFDFFAQPIADWCERVINCNYEEKLSGQDNTPRFFELGTDSTLFTMIRYPLQYFNYTGRKTVDIDRSDGGGVLVYNDLLLISGDNFIPVTIDHSAGDLIAGCVLQCFPRVFDFNIAYYQETIYTKRIIYANLIGSSYDFNQDDTSYQINVHYYALGFLDLVMNFSFPISIFIVIFLVLGVLTVFVGFVGWLICRFTTLLQNPPQIKIFSMLALVVPPGMAGVTIGVIGIFIMTALGNYLVNGYLVTDPNSPQIMPLGTLMLDIYPIQYSELLSVTVPGVISLAEQADCRTGRIGSVFAIVGILCFVVSSKMFFPKEETKREREIAEKRTELARKELWDPVLWKKANFMFCSFTFANILVCMVEFSYSSTFSDYIYTIIVMLIIVGEILKSFLFIQLNDFILIAPIMCAYNFCTQLVTFGSPDFLAFLLSYFVGVAMQMFQRVFQKTYTDAIYETGKYIVDGLISAIKSITPRYMSSKPSVDGGDNKDFRRREVDGVPESQDEADSVEPILQYFGDTCSDTQNLFYFPYFVYLLMQYRNQLVIPEAYGIRQSDMLIYMIFQVMMIFFQPFLDVFNHAQCELFHGWKIYEYLVYSRYRFLQRETRWKSMENSLDECIDEALRRIDQMCFSSQYYLMITVHMNGIIYIVLAFECWLSINYSPFSDPAFFMMVAYYIFLFVLLRWITLYLAIKLKVWKIKHENTAWHLMQRDEDDLDIPAWEEIKGASSDAYLMNQRITSETFRYKFLNYNRTWLINQLPQLLTPRTMRRSRPYLINQFARIINARRDDISDDDDNEKDKKFGPVALTAPSRNIIRWWLGKARRRIRLRTIVEPLIKRARGAQCEQCLSRKQLQVEYEIDVDKMGDMYDNVYPGDEEVDQVQWKQFWINNQRYHTICLACLTRRKEIDARNAMKGAIDSSLFDDGQEDYPDWGPVFLSAASKAMLLNWYRKAQRLRAGKRGNKRKDKVIKNISDDEGEDLQKDWLRDLPVISGATKAIATKWMRTARARLQKKHGKGAGLRESDVLEEVTQVGENFKSGRKSKMLKK